ncbi:cell division suppressor protein YneA [Texcoconibacillus texcoconensis]|uniref:LysM repeat protein n=1 Tax=Texcoconibacillus texcoconensis TaxID=1095777 RepID=A0A840QSV5_9BACI|nr:LysM peptidoglycan-binding domain-containing protein [Texcoconibacillus texcoconensis]MBB5174430.1 LysM repeat protein [Texcoconibacillus texcoconensis]
MNSKLKRLIIHFGFILVIASLWIPVLSDNVSSAENVEYETVIVEEGDRLWTIAREIEEQVEMNKQEIVQWINVKNELTSDKIYVGQTIKIPTKS